MSRKFFYLLLITLLGNLLFCESGNTQINMDVSEEKKGDRIPIYSRTLPLIQGFMISGNSVVSTQELQKLLQPFVGLEINSFNLLNIRKIVTNYYGKQGYTSSFATVESFKLKKGIVPIVVTEGKIEKINVTVNGRLRPSYVQERFETIFLNKIYNEPQVQKQILRWQEVDENIEALEVEVEINPQNPEQVTLNVIAIATRAFDVVLGSANTGSPTFGEIANGLEVSTRIFRNGDRFSATYFFSEGNEGFGFRYSVPINPRDTQLFASFSQNESNIVENPLDFADVDLNSQRYEVGFVRPIISEPTRQLSLGLTGRFEEGSGRLEGVRAPIFRGSADNGEVRTTTLRVPLNYFVRDRDDILALQSEGILGIDALGATTNEESAIDGQFAAWRNEINYVRLLGENGAYFQARGILQVASSSLPVFDAIQLGGINKGRGYREGVILSDNGLFLGGEVSLPAYRSDNLTFRVAAFLDYAKGWNTDIPNPEVSNLFSIGAGVRLTLFERILLRADYGIPLTNQDLATIGERGSQDDGWHFGISATPFRF